MAEAEVPKPIDLSWALSLSVLDSLGAALGMIALIVVFKNLGAVSSRKFPVEPTFVMTGL